VPHSRAVCCCGGVCLVPGASDTRARAREAFLAAGVPVEITRSLGPDSLGEMRALRSRSLMEGAFRVGSEPEQARQGEAGQRPLHRERTRGFDVSVPLLNVCVGTGPHVRCMQSRVGPCVEHGMAVVRSDFSA